MSLKKIVFFAIIIASLFVINSFIRSIYHLGQKNDLIVKANQELAQEKKKNEMLKKQLVVVQRPQFVEEEARNKLFLAKPGEGVVVIPTDYLQATGSAREGKKVSIPNWQQWWKLFF